MAYHSSAKETDKQAVKERQDISFLVHSYLESQLSDKAERIRKQREDKEFNFSLRARRGAVGAVLAAVLFLYFQLHRITTDLSLLQEGSTAALTALVSGIIISTTALLGFLLASVFHKANKDKPVHPMQNLLSNPDVSRIFNLSVQAPLE